MKEVKIYTTNHCGYCLSAKHLLENQEILFTEIDVSDDFDKRKWLFQTTGQRTVQQIFIGEQPIGGYMELSEIVKNKKLLEMVKDD